MKFGFVANNLHLSDGTSTAELISGDVFFEIVEPEVLEYTYRLKPAKDFGIPFVSILYYILIINIIILNNSNKFYKLFVSRISPLSSSIFYWCQHNQDMLVLTLQTLMTLKEMLHLLKEGKYINRAH